MKKSQLRQIIKEALIKEVSDEVIDIINSKYPNQPILMMSGNQRGSNYEEEGINYRPTSPNEQGKGMKPKGLWYGIGSSWVNWVRSEMPNWESEKAYVLDLNRSNMLIIRTYEELMKFNSEFSEGMGIDWGKVASIYDGIEIAPHIRESRYEAVWYLSWDIASGCIWGQNVINDSQLIR